MQILIDHRGVLAVALALVIGTLGQRVWPFPVDNALLALMSADAPAVYRLLASLYAVLWYSTPLLSLHAALAALSLFVASIAPPPVFHPLPPYPPPSARAEPFLIIGEQHYLHSSERAHTPRWISIPERGLCTGIAILGATGSGKTSSCLYPFADQLFGWAAHDADRKMAGVILEVKGDFCKSIQRILTRHGRAEDYVELRLDGEYCYNPIAGDLEPYAVAYSIATCINQLYGHSKEPFWQQAYTHAVKNIIAAARLADGYTTLADVYRYCISPDALHDVVERARRRHVRRSITISRATLAEHQEALSTLAVWQLGADDRASTVHTDTVARELAQRGVPHDITEHPSPTTPDDGERFSAVDRWYRDEWLRLEARLRTSIVEGIAVFLGLFDDSPAVKRTFCPPAHAYTDPGSYPMLPLPPLEDLIETGKVIALNFPASLNPGLSRIVGVLFKQSFHSSMLARIPKLEAGISRSRRYVVEMIDECHQFVSAGGMDPAGDERALPMTRQARLVPIFATQSLSSLRSALGDESAWRTLLQCFRTRIFLALSDDFSAQVAADICGRSYQARPEYTISEAGQDTTVSLLTGRPGAHKATITATKHYALRLEYTFQPSTFTTLRNAQAIVAAYDGVDPLPPTFCFLKPHYLDVSTSYFDQVAQGLL